MRSAPPLPIMTLVTSCGRPRTFDEDVVLDRALEVFWRDGYGGASLQSLLSHMGISRQSLYNTFGDKRRLFLAALDRYVDKRADELLGVLEAPDASYPAVLEFFQSLGACSGQQPKSCMVGRSCMELGVQDPEVAARIHRFFDRTVEAFHHALGNAVAKGEIEPVDTAAVARFLTATVHGLGMMARGGTPPEQLREVVEIALSVLRPVRAT